ncbi:peptidase inhibitor family I36 protein, partial [Vibrio parahaemolyticus]
NKKGKKYVLTDDVPFLEGMNDKMSSWSIPAGWEVRFYEHENYQGRYYTRGSGHGNTDGWNDMISSVKILNKQ